ncbi:carboxypeptidase regulatory-like domain-containing protein [Oxalobacteraceae bacterium]|nr:carboxypeptidase regulatory-like domain-containing protein [Oxalobacteraceae bacterium]
MSAINLAATIHVCEDTNGTFDIRAILADAGFTTPGALNIDSFAVILPDGNIEVDNTPLFGTVDADTIYVRPGQWHVNYNGDFATFELVVDQGGGDEVTLSLQVFVDPVNDAPTALDKDFILNDGAPVVLGEADFGFNDPVEHDGFKAVIITSLPTAGTVTLNGVAVAAGTEVAIADIRAGQLAFVPSATSAGTFDIGFKVRDAGGLVGCGAADTSATPNHLTFTVPLAHLGDFVWNDSNANGVQDGGETGIAGVTVQLKDAGGAVVATTTTDGTGAYHFDVSGGTYSVTVQTPAGYAVSDKDQGGNDALDSDIDASGNTGAITLAPGQTNNTIDAGLYKTAALGDTVWLDTNRNGQQDAGEAGVAGVKVTLLDANGNAVGAAVSTDAAGHYQFSGLKPGSYSVVFDKTTLPANHDFTAAKQGGDAAKDSDVDASGHSATVLLAAGDNNVDIDAGIVARPATLGDRVWEDKNANGVQDAGEAGIAGVAVDLKDAQGNVVKSTSTDANGNYSFTVDPGTYSVSVTPGAGYNISARDQGGNDATDSDIDAAGQSAAVTLAAGEVNNTIDAGLYKNASLGDKVWLDADRDGVQDANEVGKDGVTVNLLDAGGAVVASTVTANGGAYLFDNLKPGTYSVQFDKASLPSGYSFTGKDLGGDYHTDSDADQATGKTIAIKLNSGDAVLTVDAGIVAPLSHLGDTVWEDKNANGLQDGGESGIAGITVQLKDAAGAVLRTTTTDGSGHYNFDVEAGTYSINVATGAYKVSAKDVGANDAIDSDIGATGQSANVTIGVGETNNTLDAGLYKNAALGDRVWLDSNQNGVQDAGEAGVCGVKIKLLDANGVQVGSTQTTDANGNYLFSDLKPGSYSVQLDKASLPKAYTITAQDQGGNDAIDSDANSDGKSGLVTLTSGQTDRSTDIGLVAGAQIGDKVWCDANANGIQDAGEAGIGGVTVSLLNEAGSVIGSTKTDASGSYLFKDLNAGKYSLAFAETSGYVFTKRDASGSTDANDSDAQAGNYGAAGNGKTIQTTLAVGESDRSWDAGMVKAASIGDRVWEDLNYNGVQDSGESGICGVTVELHDAATNALIATKLTDSNGNYLFGGLQAGNYKVDVIKGSSWNFTKTNQGSNDAADSDVTAIASGSNTGRSGVISLSAGENDSSIDAGLYRKASIGDKVWRDSNHNGLQDSGEEGIGNIRVSLFDGNNNQVGNTVLTDGNGNYKFADLNPGTYYLKFDKANVAFKGYNMSDWKWGVKNVGGDDSRDSDVAGDGISKVNITYTDKTTLISGENDMSWDATITPIVIDLNGDGVHTIARSAFAGSFDLLGTGKAIQSGWVSASDGMLAVDGNGNGSIDSIAELFGGLSKGDGFAKLASYDSNGDGLVDAHDSGFGALRIWQDANSNGKTDAGELLSLQDAGVSSLVVAFKEMPFLDANNNLHLERSSATLSSGATVDMTDVYFNVAAADAAAAGITTPTIADLLQDHSQVTLIGQCEVQIA